MKGLSTAVIALILTVTTLIVMLGVFSLYSFYFSKASANISQQTYLISLSKMISFQVSQMAFYGIQPTLKYFNVSYLIWVSTPTKVLTIVVFNATPSPQSLISYTLPKENARVGLFKSQIEDYASIKSFTLNSNVYLPNGVLLGTVNVKAYNISSNTTYVLSSIIKPDNIIIIWALYYYQGKWYRLAWTYVAPLDQGLGAYILSSSGIYGSSNPKNAIPPHYVTSEKGIMFGLWFKVLNTQTSSLISNYTFNTVNNNNISIIAYMKFGALYANISEDGETVYTTMVSQGLNQGSWYFLNISFGSILGQSISIDLYSANQSLLNAISIPQSQLGSLNGYLARVKFGSSTLAVGISQAFAVSLQSSDGIQQFYNVSQTELKNDPYYNDTNNLEQIIYNAKNKLYSTIYWYFVWSYSNSPSSSIPAIMWYWTIGGGSSKLNTAYIYPVGQNTYTFG